MEKHSKYLKAILTEMCKRVKAKYDSINFKAESWFSSRSWTEKEQDDFELWLVDYMHKNEEARMELMERPRADKRDLKKFAKAFTFFCGWSLKGKI